MPAISINPRLAQALAISRGLRFYAKHSRSVNTAYTPQNMMAMARNLTGNPKLFGKDYIAAAEAIEAAFNLESGEAAAKL